MVETGFLVKAMQNIISFLSETRFLRSYGDWCNILGKIDILHDVRGVIRGGGRVYLICLLPGKSLANPPLQVIDRVARCQLKPTTKLE